MNSSSVGFSPGNGARYNLLVDYECSGAPLSVIRSIWVSFDTVNVEGLKKISKPLWIELLRAFAKLNRVLWQHGLDHSRAGEVRIVMDSCGVDRLAVDAYAAGCLERLPSAKTLDDWLTRGGRASNRHSAARHPFSSARAVVYGYSRTMEPHTGKDRGTPTANLNHLKSLSVCCLGHQSCLVLGCIQLVPGAGEMGKAAAMLDLNHLAETAKCAERRLLEDKAMHVLQLADAAYIQATKCAHAQLVRMQSVMASDVEVMAAACTKFFPMVHPMVGPYIMRSVLPLSAGGHVTPWFPDLMDKLGLTYTCPDPPWRPERPIPIPKSADVAVTRMTWCKHNHVTDAVYHLECDGNPEFRRKVLANSWVKVIDETVIEPQMEL